VIAAVGYAVVVAVAEVERARTHQPDRASHRSEQRGELVVDLPMRAVGYWCDVVGPLPHLVERVDPELPPVAGSAPRAL
jgi:hypothetical protein